MGTQQAEFGYWQAALPDKDMDPTFSKLDTEIIPHLYDI